MITYFRKIRRAIIDSDRAKRYFLYAIGEILLVMIGILLALQVNNWNQKRIEKNKERLLLYEINAEFVLNKAELLSTMNYYHRVQEKYTKLINLFPIDPRVLNLDTLSSLLQRTEATRDVDLSQGSISSLLNSSSYEIISNPELRTLLLQWNDLVSNYKEAESLLIQFTVDKYRPYLDEQIPMPHFEGIKDSRTDLAFLRSVKFENMIKRRKSLIDDMDFIMFRLDDGKIIQALDRIIELSAIGS